MSGNKQYFLYKDLFKDLIIQYFEGGDLVSHCTEPEDNMMFISVVGVIS